MKVSSSPFSICFIFIAIVILLKGSLFIIDVVKVDDNRVENDKHVTNKRQIQRRLNNTPSTRHQIQRRLNVSSIINSSLPHHHQTVAELLSQTEPVQATSPLSLLKQLAQQHRRQELKEKPHPLHHVIEIAGPDKHEAQQQHPSLSSSPAAAAAPTIPFQQNERVRVLETKTFASIVWTPMRYFSPENERLIKSVVYLKKFLDDIENNETPLDERTGIIYSVANGSIAQPFDCGFRASEQTLQTLLRPPLLRTKHVQGYLVPILVPEGQTFQHFLDGVFPKLVFALPWIEKLNATVMLDVPRDAIIFEIVSRLVPRHRLLLYDNHQGGYWADQLLHVCHCPPIHPVLWQRMSRSLGVPTAATAPGDGLIIALHRNPSNARNRGRHILNFDQLIDRLIDEFGKDRVVSFDSNQHNFQATLDLFARATIVIGSHGGLMFNILFAPPNITVFEFHPTRPDGNLFLSHAGVMPYVFASLRNQNFYRIHVPSKNGNVNIPIHDLIINIKKL